MTDFSITAKSYAEALFVIAQKDNSLENWICFLEDISSLMSNDCFFQFIDHPDFEKSIKLDLFLELLSLERTSKKSTLIKELLERKRFVIVPQILFFLKELKDEHEGVALAKIFTAFQVSDEQVNHMISIFESKFNLKLRPQVLIDKSLIGGVKVVVGDRILDASIKNKLDELKNTLLAI
ncbi:F0F1 ATP synthase subunit delta [Candidatus Kinetoplastidibacterium crithidiae]|uniref:ATP synthase subunit delta n=1 Tax=Candidatus Kinetoplastidibacterium crithidiae TCC036E TaxID=1208918 RepID=M1M5B4_9PROT|nr:F0F1 ATP synthase subunit delta [Candidatus Kinetoplastibacterium crithidii]AFZ83077.1 ATP synthase delta chain [Candidatus Kinetoplastibacterium crithidii (ex Angomonas deanei ATCC 30255)]AGF47355.1 F-type H+-transporting ATPase subunit delta [Candidatus Kinetoplastibacterium crithidii TCC036E]